MKPLRLVPLVLAALAGMHHTAYALCGTGYGPLSGGGVECETLHTLEICLSDAGGDELFAGLPLAHVEQQVRRVAETWNTGGGADMHLTYLGARSLYCTEPSTGGQRAGTVVIHETNTCECDGPGMACARPEEDFSVWCGWITTGGNIYIHTNPACFQPAEAGNTWGLLGVDGAAPHVVDLSGILTHEIGHVLGINHPFECGECAGPGEYCGTMDGTTALARRMRNIGRWDAENLQSLYGYPHDRILIDKSADALSWTPRSPSPPLTWTPEMPLLGVTSDEGDLSLVWSQAGTHQVWFGNGDESSWFFENVSVAPNDLTFDPPVIAGREGYPHQYMVAYTTEELDNASRRIRTARSSDNGFSWTLANVFVHGVEVRTFREGVVIAHDSDTDRYVLGLLNDGDQILLLTTPATGGGWISTTLSQTAIDPPSIACRHARGTNCLMVWAATDALHCLETAPLDILGDGTVAMGPVNTQCFPQEAGPQIAFDETDVAFPWKLTFKQRAPGTDVIYTFRRGTGNWVDQRSHVFSDQMWQPGIGSLVNLVSDELDLVHIAH